jgi:hypothetical protein
LAEAPRTRFWRGLLIGFAIGLLSFISECGFGGIRRSAPISRLASRGSLFMSDSQPRNLTPQELLVQRALLAHAVGYCLAAWSGVEGQLHEMFLRQVIFRSRNKNKWVMARFVWSAIISFEGRLNMLDGSITGNLWQLDTRKYKKVKDDWRLIYNYIGKRVSLRNEIAHGTMVNFNTEMMIVPYATSHPWRDGISIQAINDRAKLFIELDFALQWLSLCLSALWKPSLKRHVLNQRPTPDLVLRLRAEAARSRKGKKARRQSSHRKRRAHR